MTGVVLMGSGAWLMALAFAMIRWDMGSDRLEPVWWVVALVGLLLFWGSILIGLGGG